MSHFSLNCSSLRSLRQYIFLFVVWLVFLQLSGLYSSNQIIVEIPAKLQIRICTVVSFSNWNNSRKNGTFNMSAKKKTAPPTTHKTALLGVAIILNILSVHERLVRITAILEIIGGKCHCPHLIRFERKIQTAQINRQRNSKYSLSLQTAKNYFPDSKKRFVQLLWGAAHYVCLFFFCFENNRTGGVDN